MLVAVGYEQQINFHIDCCMSLGGVYISIRVIGCFLPPLDYTKNDLSIQKVHQYYCCMLHLH